MNYPNLLKPVKVGDHVIKNRMVYPNASPHFLQGPETFPAEGYRAFNANLAKNGAAIVTIAEWDNYPAQRQGPQDSDMVHMQAFDMTDPSAHNYFSQMAEEIHFYGSKILVSTSLVFPEGYSLNGGKSRGPGGGKETQAIPKEKIPEAIDAFVKKIRLFKNLGYDGMSLRCDMQLVPGKNERTDEYGGNLENRTRFMRECFEAVKKAFGGKFIIEGVIAWEQPDGYGGTNPIGSGYFESDSMEFIRLTEGVIDIMQIREGNGCASHPTGYNFRKGVHPTVDFCARAKAAGVKMLLEPIGGFQEPEEMDKYIAEGKCDMFGMSRAFIADPEFGVKMYEGRGEDVTPCLKCNKCHGTILPDPEPWLSICSVNPKQGLGHKIDRLVSDEPLSKKKVAVIGGGPAGIRSALYASERGHDVTLFEKTGTLGGQLFHGDYLPFKWPIGNYKRWLIEQLSKSEVKVVMNTAPTTDMIKAGGYDAVFACTGAEIALPDGIKGLKDENGELAAGLWTCLGTYGKADKLGKKVVIIGGSEVGMETAMYLCGEGHDVTILTRQGRIAHNASRLHYITAAFVKHGEDGLAYESPAWEMYDNLDYVVNATTTEIRANEVVYVVDGKEQTISADSIVICGGMTPLTDEAMEYAGLTQEFYTIGDCNGAGNLEVCNREAYSRAMML